MRRLVFAPSCYSLAASWRACAHLSHPLLEHAVDTACYTSLAGHHDRSPHGSNAAIHSHETAHPSHTTSQQRSCSSGRRPLLPPPTTPCSIGGTPFPYFLQRIIEDKTKKLFHERLKALEFLRDVATPASTTPRLGSAGEEAEARQQLMSMALHRARKPTLSSSLNRGTSLPIAVCLHPPEGHVCVPKVVGETYLLLRSHGVDVTAWWERYYTAFIRPSMEGRPGGETVVGATVTSDRGVGRATAPLVTGHCDPSVESNSEASPPPFYWKLDKCMSHRGAIHGSSLQNAERFALPLPSFDEPLLPWSALPTSQLDALGRGGDGVPTSMGVAAAAFANPPARQLVWIPVNLIWHLPFFPIPFPSVCAEGDPRQARPAEACCGDTALASAGLPLTSHDIDSWMAEENERVLQQREEDEPTEAGCLLSRQDAASLPNSGDDALLETSRGDSSACFSESSPRHPMPTPRRRAHALEGQLIEEQWMHPFFDNLHEASSADIGTLLHPTLFPSNGDDVPASHDVTATPQAWRNCQRVLQSSTSALDLVSSNTRLPTTTTSDVFSTAATAEWPPPLCSWLLRRGHWKGLSSFWATKADPASLLVVDYIFPVTAYPLLRYRALRQAQTERADTSTCKPHLRPFSPWSKAAMRARDGASKKWRPFFWRHCGAAQHRSHLNAVLPAYSRDGEEGPMHPLTSAIASGGAGCSRNDTEVTRAKAVFQSLLRSSSSERATFFGVQYISVEATALSCLVDSTVCVRHAVPLSVTGTVLVRGLRPTRYRQQHSCLNAAQRRALTVVKNDCRGVRPAAHGVAVRARAPQLPFFEAAMRKLMVAEAAVATTESAQDRIAATRVGESELESTSDTPPWLARLREIRNECDVGNTETWASRIERVVSMRSSLRAAFFLFQSPYWVEVTGVYERWGVRVAPEVVPLLIDGESYVNAEQTTDASRFTQSTCVPHLQQQVIFSGGLGACTWAGSQRLLNRSAPGATPRRRPGGVCAWTYSTLCDRAAAVQRVSNLWIAESVIESFKWTLRAVPTPPRPEEGNQSCLGGPVEVLRSTLPLLEVQPGKLQESLCEELQDEALRRQSQQRCGSPWHVDSRRSRVRSPLPPPPCEPPTIADGSPPKRSRDIAQLHCTVIHSSCVVEQAELQFVAEYSPQVLLMRVPELTSGDRGFDAWKAAERMATNAARSANTQSTGAACDKDTVRCTTEARAEGPHTSYREFDWEGDDGDETFMDDSARDCMAAQRSVLALQKHAQIMRLRAVHQKRSLYSTPWKGAKLTFRSRLELSHLALREGYSPANASRWVSFGFLRDESGVRAARTRDVALKVNAQRADESELTHPVSAYGAATAASSAQRKGGPPSTLRGITGIEVDVFLCSSSRPHENRPCAADDGDIEHGNGVGINDDVTDGCSTGSQLKRIALINYEELEWSDAVISSSRERWVWKYL